MIYVMEINKHATLKFIILEIFHTNYAIKSYKILR